MSPRSKVATIGSAGRFLPGIVARIVKEDGSLAGDGEQGELVVRGPAMALRYSGNEKAYVIFLSLTSMPLILTPSEPKRHSSMDGSGREMK